MTAGEFDTPTTDAGDSYEPRALQRAFEHFARALFRFYVRLDVANGDPLPAEPFLLCSNHTSHLDGTALMVAAGLPFDTFRLLAAADYFRPDSTAGRLTRGVLHIVAVDRETGRSVRLRRTIAECGDLIRTRRVRLIAFPEGTRSTTGRLLPFKRGPAFLAVSLGLPIVPAYIDGASSSMPKGAWMPKPGRVQVRFGAPIRPAEWNRVEGLRAQSDFVTQELEQRVRLLAGSTERVGQPG